MLVYALFRLGITSAVENNTCFSGVISTGDDDFYRVFDYGVTTINYRNETDDFQLSVSFNDLIGSTCTTENIITGAYIQQGTNIYPLPEFPIGVTAANYSTIFCLNSTPLTSSFYPFNLTDPGAVRLLFYTNQNCTVCSLLSVEATGAGGK